MRISGLALGCGIVVLGGRVSLAQVVYVNAAAGAGGDGRSWAGAFSDLQDGLNLADADPSVREVWVAAGKYYPGAVGAPPSSRFVVSRVAVYGGFVGDETAREQRRRDRS